MPCMDPLGMGKLQRCVFGREIAWQVYLHASRRFKHSIGNMEIKHSQKPRKGGNHYTS